MHVKMLNLYVKFTSHLRSLDILVAPSEAQLKEFGFTDINNALESTIEALKNAPSLSTTGQATKADIASMVQEAMREDNKTSKCEILTTYKKSKIVL